MSFKSFNEKEGDIAFFSRTKVGYWRKYFLADFGRSIRRKGVLGNIRELRKSVV